MSAAWARSRYLGETAPNATTSGRAAAGKRLSADARFSHRRQAPDHLQRADPRRAMTTPDAIAAAKAGLRRTLLAARAQRTPAARREAGRRIAAAAADLLGDWSPAVAAVYLAIGTEPPTDQLIAVLADRGCRLIVPILRDDGDLDWTPYHPADPTEPGLRGTLIPTQPRALGVEAVSTADLIVVPALAVDPTGVRLGRGGGGYDRALRRRSPGSLTVAVIYDDELVPSLPEADHDQRVDAALTPSRTHRFRAGSSL